MQSARTAPAGQRSEELDFLRGLSVIGMILVITPGDWAMRFNWLNHAQWAGFSLADMIFPGFLFCVGACLPLSLARREAAGAGQRETLRYIFRRAGLLILLGVAINAFPDFDWSNSRLPGVLQRIGLCWALAAVAIYYTAKREVGQPPKPGIRTLLLISAVTLLGYWLLLALVPVPGFGSMRFDAVGSWPAYIDRLVFGVDHLWPYGTSNGVVTYDPEGLIATLPATVNVIFGAIFGGYLLERRAVPSWKGYAAGALLLLCGYAFSAVFPSIKKIWSSSFVLISGGFSLVCLMVIRNLIRWGFFRAVLQPCRVYGANALLGFCIFMLLSAVLDRPLIGTGAEQKSGRQLGYQLVQKLVSDPQWASLLFSIMCLALFYFVFLLMYRKSWFFRV